MEYLVAFLTLLATVAYAVVIAVNIERGKRWAMEVARAFSMLDPSAFSHQLTLEARDEPVEKTGAETPADRLAA